MIAINQKKFIFLLSIILVLTIFNPLKAEWITKKSDISKELLKVDDMYSKGYLTISECTKMKAKLLKISSATGMCDDVISVVKNKSNEIKSFDWMAEVRHPKTNKVFTATRLSTKQKAINLAIKKCYEYVSLSLNKIGYNDCYVSKSANVKNNNNDVTQIVKQEKFNEILKNIENSPIGDYYVFGHATTGEKFWGSTESINRTTNVGVTTSTSGRSCKIISKLKNNKMPFKGSFSLECPMEKVKGSWTQETDTSPGIGQAFTDKGDVITAFFSSSRLEVKNFAKKFLNNQETQIAQIEKNNQEEFKPKKSNQDNKAPVIEIAEAITVNDTSYILEGRVTDKADKIFVEIDGQPVQVKKGKFKVKRYSPVDEQIKIVAIDQWGNKSKTKLVSITIDIDETTVANKLEPLNPSNISNKSSNNKVALIIGIENYTEAPKANYANLDAKYFFDYARRAFGVNKQNINLLVNEEATVVKTDKAVSLWLKSKIKKNKSDLIIFFAGHGLASSDGKELYLLPQDGNPDRLERTALSRTDLFKEIISLNPKSVTMFLDTCYSGVSRDEQMLLASARPIRIVADEQSEIPNNFTIFSASKLDQISSGLKEANHGIFSYYLMKGLEGKADSNNDKRISNGELLAYMDENVSQKAAEQGRAQNPSLTGNPDKILIDYR